MSTKGIQILDKKNNVVSVELPDIFQEVKEGDQFYWSILYLQATGNLGEGKSISALEKQIRESKNGIMISWSELLSLMNKLDDVVDVTIIGSKNKNAIKRYDNDQEMYELCDIVIEMIDSSYWEIFSNDEDLIERLSKKFKKTRTLTTSFRGIS